MFVNIHEAKTHFSRLVNQALKGEEVIITRGGTPLIRLVPYTKEIQFRHGGQFKGIIEISDDFDAPLPQEILNQFYGNEK